MKGTPLIVESDQLPRPRRRVRVAQAVLRRVDVQRERFATDYGAATTTQQRFAVAVNALRAAAAPGSHQSNPEAVAYRLDRLTDAATALLSELHAEQRTAAHRVLRAEQRRVERAERKRRVPRESETASAA